MARDIASEAACWVHIDKESKRFVFTRGADPQDAISCPVSWLGMMFALARRDDPEAAAAILAAEHEMGS